MKVLSGISWAVLSLSLWTMAALAAMPPQTTLPSDSPAQRSLTLQPVWSVGGEDDEDVLLGVITSAVMDQAGNTYLLDNQLAQVLVINPDGELINTLGGPGEGPGELSQPTSVILVNETRIGVAQGFPGKIVLLDTDGNPAGTITPEQEAGEGGFAFLPRIAQRDGHLVVVHGKGGFDMETGKMTSTSVLAALDSEGHQLAEFASHQQVRSMTKQVYDEEAAFSELSTWALGHNQVFTVPVRDQYLINVKNMDGQLIRTISRPFQARKREAADKDELTSGMVMVVNGEKLEIEKHILDFDPAILNLNVADDGKLFVTNCYQKSSRLNPGQAGRYDIIDPGVGLVEELTLELPGFNPGLDSLLFLDGKNFLCLKNIKGATDNLRSSFGDDGNGQGEENLDEAEPLEVILCRLPG